MFQSAFDIAGKTLLQCYLIDEEMFVGEQRFACKEVLAFIEFHKNDEGRQEKFGKLQRYVKGMKATLDANVPLVRDEDPDEEENRKLEHKKKKGSDEESGEDDEEEEEEQEEEKPQAKKPEKGSDESSEEESEEESEDEDDDDSEEESEEDNQSNLFAKNMFGASSQPNQSNLELAKMGTVRSIQASQVHVNSKTNLSGFGKTAFSVEKADESRDSPFRISGNDFKNNKSDVSVSEMSQSRSTLFKATPNKDKSSMLFGGWNDLHNELEGAKNAKEHSMWKPLESSVISSGSSQSRRPLGRRQQHDTSANESVINLADASAMTHTTKLIEKSGINNNNTMRSDKHNVFNKSKIQASTMRLEYDDDDEDNSKYRL